MFGEEKQEARDLTRAVLARARSRVAIDLADEAYRGALWSVLRTELGESVTRVSAFLLALLECENLILDDLAWLIEPARGWPHLMSDRGRGSMRGRRLVGAIRRDLRRSGTSLRHHGITVHVRDGGLLRLHVVENSLEIIGRVAGVGIRTRFGAVRLAIPGALPDSVVRTCVGLPAAAVVDLPALIGRDWPVVGLYPSTGREGWTLIVRAGSASYRMPWVR